MVICTKQAQILYPDSSYKYYTAMARDIGYYRFIKAECFYVKHASFRLLNNGAFFASFMWSILKMLVIYKMQNSLSF